MDKKLVEELVGATADSLEKLLADWLAENLVDLLVARKVLS